MNVEIWYASLYAKLAHREPRLIDTRRLCSRAEDIGFGWYIVGRRYSFGLVEKAILSQHQQRKVSTCNLILWR